MFTSANRQPLFARTPLLLKAALLILAFIVASLAPAQDLGLRWMKAGRAGKLSYSGDGKVLFGLFQDNGHVNVYRMSDTTLVAAVPTPTNFYSGIQPVHDGSGYYYSRGEKMYFYSLATRTATEVWTELNGYTGLDYVALSTDGTKVAYVGKRLSDNRTTVSIVDLATSTLIRRIFLPVDVVTHQLSFVNGDTRLLMGGLRLYRLDGSLVSAKVDPLTDFFVLNRERTRAYAVDNANTMTRCFDLVGALTVVWKKGVLGLSHSMQVSSDGKVLMDTESTLTHYIFRCWSTVDGTKLPGHLFPDTGTSPSPYVTAPDKNEFLVCTTGGTDRIQRWAFDSSSGNGDRLPDISEGMSNGVAPMGTATNPLFATERSSSAWYVRNPSDGSLTGMFLGHSPGITGIPDKVSPNGKFYLYVGHRLNTTTDWGIYVRRTSDLSIVAADLSPDVLDSPAFYGWASDSRIYVYHRESKRVRVLSFNGTSLSKVIDITESNPTRLALSADAKRLVATQESSNFANVHNVTTGALIGQVQMVSPNSHGLDYWTIVANKLAIHEWVSLDGGQYQNQVRFIDLLQDTLPLYRTVSYSQPNAMYDHGFARVTPDGSLVIFAITPSEIPANFIPPSNLKMIRVQDNAVIRDFNNLPFGPITAGIAIMNNGSILIGNSATAFFAIDIPASLATLSINPTSVFGGQTSTATVTLSNPAGNAGAVVELSADPGLGVPATVTIPSGQKTASFTVTTSGVNVDTTKFVRAALDGLTLQVPLRVKKATKVTLSLNPVSVDGGQSSVGTVTLDGAAGPGGLAISLASDKPYATVPASVLVTEGQSTATFTVNTVDPGATGTALISATMTGSTASATLEVKSPWVVTADFVPATTKGGNALELVVSIAPAPPTDRTYNLAGDGLLVPPSTVTILAGNTSATVTVNTLPTLTTKVGKVTLSNALGFSKDVLATVEAPAISALFPALTRTLGPSTFDVVVLLDGPAPAGLVLNSTSSSVAVATVPAQVTVGEKLNYAIVKVTVKKQTLKRMVTITIGGKSFVLTVLP